MARGQRGGLAVAAVVAAPLVVFVFPMVDLIGRNAEYFGGDLTSGAYVYAVAVLLGAVGVLAVARRDRVPLRVLALAVALLAPGWLLYQVVHPLTGKSIALAGSLAAVLAVALSVGWRSPSTVSDRVLGGLGQLGVLLVLVFGVQTAIAFGSPAGGSDGTDGEPRTDGPHPNIYHVVLDEFQTDAFSHVLDDEMERDLAGFTFFPDAITAYGRTEMALATVFSEEDYAYRGSLTAYTQEAFQGDGSALRQLDAAGYWTEAYVHSFKFFGRADPFDRSFIHRDVAGSPPAGDRRLALSLWAYANLPVRLADPLLPERHLQQLQGGVLLPDEEPPTSVASFERLVAEEERRPATGQYVLGHFILPHFPYVLTGDCAYVPGAVTDVLAQSRCAVTKVVELLDELDRLGRFEDAVIVVHGDHGARHAVIDGQLRDVEDQGPFSEAFSRARSRPLLLLKPSGVSRAEQPRLRTSDLPARLADIFPTVFASLGLAQGHADRASLLGEPFPVRSTRYYHFYDKHPEDIIDGPLHRYAIEQGTLRFDREVQVPRS